MWKTAALRATRAIFSGAGCSGPTREHLRQASQASAPFTAMAVPQRYFFDQFDRLRLITAYGYSQRRMRSSLTAFDDRPRMLLTDC